MIWHHAYCGYRTTRPRGSDLGFLERVIQLRNTGREGKSIFNAMKCQYETGLFSKKQHELGLKQYFAPLGMSPFWRLKNHFIQQR